MPINLTVDGIVIPYPLVGETGWGVNATKFAATVANSTLQLTGGAFPLTADINFGTSYGLVSKYFKSDTASIATAGTLRLAIGDTINWGTANNSLSVSGTNLEWNGSILNTGLASLTDGMIWIGNALNVPTPTTLTGDVTVSDAGVTAIGALKIVNAQVSNSAAIAYSKLNLSGSITNSDIYSSAAIGLSKLAALNASIVPVTDGSGFLTSSSTTVTELGYVHGVTSSIQTQLNAKQATLTEGNLTEATSSVLTITGGTSAVIGSGTSIQVKQSSSTVSGYLSSTDWSTFNSKQATLTLGNLTDSGTDGITVTGGTGAVVGSGTSISQHVADSSHAGYLSSTDWSTFNGKQASLTIGNISDVGTDGITITGGTSAIIGSGVTLSQHVADSSHAGYLSSTDWSTFNNKQATLSGTTHQVIITGTTLSTPQNIDTNSTPTFGSVTLSNSGLILQDTEGTPKTITIKAPATITPSSYTLLLPVAQSTGSQALFNDGSGNLSWSTPSGSGTVNTGTAGQLAYYATSTNAVSGSSVTVSGSTITGSLTGHASLDLALTGGTMSGAIAMGANKITGLANGTAATDAAAFGQVFLLQSPIQGTYATQASTTSGTYADTGIQVTVSPVLTTSHILVDFDIPIQVQGTSSSGAPTCDIIITDSSNTTIQEYLDVLSLNLGISQEIVTAVIRIRGWDAPGSTSAKTYKVRFRVNSNSGAGTNTMRTCPSGEGQTTAFFTAMEYR